MKKLLGFTLIEVMIVTAIVGILMSVGLSACGKKPPQTGETSSVQAQKKI